MEINEKIIFFIETLYWLSEDKKEELIKILDELDEETKEQVAIIFYDRYNAHIKNIKTYNTDLQLIYNNLEEWLEKLETQEVNFNF